MADAVTGEALKQSRRPRSRPARLATDTPRRRTRSSAIGEEGARATRSRSEAVRKAPTPLGGERTVVANRRRHLTVMVTIIIVGMGSSAAVGYLDRGMIDVNQVITERNERIARGELQEQIIPVQNTNREPDGGLVGLGIGGPEPTTVPANASTTGSSTAAVATSSATTTDLNEPVS